MTTHATINKKRIAKNTLLLFLRQFFSMFVSLYTTRLILELLGTSDFGLYNVVCGILPLFTFFVSSMTSATQRYIAVYIGKGNIDRLKITFSTIVYIYWGLALIILIATETIGLWFLNYKMVIPENRLFTANIIYQLSIVSCIVSVISTPYNSAIVAHERLDLYAYVGILEVILRLIVVLLLFIFPAYDNLLIYAIGLLGISLISRFIYQIYSYKHFAECKSVYKFDRSLYKSILSYTSYNMIGSLAIIGKNQGVNLLINLFFGTLINAAQGIAMQVVNVVNTFVSNINMSTRPQIIKLYSAGDWEQVWKLCVISSKFSFYLTLLISTPIIVGIEMILGLWLDKYPDYTAIFIRLILIDVLIQLITNQLIALMQAENRIKSYQLCSSTLVLLVLPISYILYIQGLPPYCVYAVSICTSIIFSVVIVGITNKQIKSFSVKDFFQEILYPIVRTIVISIVISIPIVYIIDNLIARSICICIVTCLAIIIVGMNRSERKQIMDSINRYIKSHKYAI